MNLRQAIVWPVYPTDGVHTGKGVTHADGSYQLKDTAQQYKPGSQFPHLAGCKMLAVPALPYDEVGHVRKLLGHCHAPCWLLRCAVKLHNMTMSIAAAHVDFMLPLLDFQPFLCSAIAVCAIAIECS